MSVIYTATEEVNGERIDKALASMQQEWSRTQIQGFVQGGFVNVNGQEVNRKYKVQVGDVIEVNPPEPEPLEIIAEDLNLEIVYEDSDVLVVNKPSRGDNDQIGTFRQGNMLHLMAEIPVKGIHHGAAAGELFKGQGGDEFRGVFGHDNFHSGMLLDQGRCQGGRLVGGNAAGDAKKNGFSFQHGETS